jgi:hypothetical protein
MRALRFVRAAERRTIVVNWDDPAERFRLIERVGPYRYNELRAEHQRNSIVAEAGGHAIRITMSERFGRLFLVGETGRAFANQAQAETYARKKPR